MANGMELREIDLTKLLSGLSSEDRALYSNFGTLGQLFNNFDGPVATPKNANNWVFFGSDGKPSVYDTWEKKWVPLTNQLFNIIPNTYTFAPRPENVAMELDYFVRGSGLINHSFVWSHPSISKNEYGLVATHTNITNHGRFTVTPWVPHMNQLGRMQKGFYVLEHEDWNFIYGIQKKHN